MKPIAILAAVTALLALAGCDEKPQAAKIKPWTGAPLPVHEITMDIDAKAMQALTEANDKLRVTVKYYGLPTQQSASKANDLHELEMGSVTLGITRDTKSFKITGEGVDVTLLPDTADGQIQFKAQAVGITQANLYHDIVECSISRGVLTKPQSAPKVMKCSLKTP